MRGGLYQDDPLQPADVGAEAAAAAPVALALVDAGGGPRPGHQHAPAPAPLLPAVGETSRPRRQEPGGEGEGGDVILAAGASSGPLAVTSSGPSL